MKRGSQLIGRSGGMTMIELSIVIGIVSLLLAVTLSLSRHVIATSNIRRAQIGLGAWHEAMQQWFLQFGEYPYARVTESGTQEELMGTGREALRNLSNVVSRAGIEIQTGAGTVSNVTFQVTLPPEATIKDPWGIPYIYQCDPGRRSYKLFSCGPDQKSEAIGDASQTSRDDIFLER